MNAFQAVLKRDLMLAMRRKNEFLTGGGFFIIVASMFPLAVGPDMKILRLIGPGILWVAALLASMLMLAQLFEADLRDGTLEQLRLSPQPMGLLVFAKILAHWLVCGFPLVLLSPILALQFDLAWDAVLVLALSLLLGTPSLSLIGSIGAALTLGLRGAGALLTLLVLPWFVPVLVFGAGAVEAQVAGLGAQAQISILLALLTSALVFAPWACSAALKISLE